MLKVGEDNAQKHGRHPAGLEGRHLLPMPKDAQEEPQKGGVKARGTTRESSPCWIAM